MSHPRRSSALLDELLTGTSGEDRTGEIEDALAALDDPASVAPLLAVLCDQAAQSPLRTAVGRILDRLTNAPDHNVQQLRAWWNTGDLILQRHALGHMEGPLRTTVEGVLNDPSHPLHADAIETLANGFDEEWATQRLIAALANPDRSARIAAARALYWSESVRALPGLIAAAHDPDPSVATEVLNTLRFYPSRQAISAAHSLRSHMDEAVRSAAQRCWEELRDDVIDTLIKPHTETYLRAFFAPVWTLLAVTQADIDAARAPSLAARSQTDLPLPDWLASPNALQEFLHRPDLERDERESMYRAPWERVPEAQRGEMAQSLAQSPHVVVRECAARVAGIYRQREVLLALLNDAKLWVRKSATYYLRELPPEPALAARAWSRLPTASGIDARQTLETAVALDAPRVWWPRVAALVQATEVEEELRCCAVQALERVGATDPLIPCMQLLLQPPQRTWALHIALLEAAIALRLPLPDCSHLTAEDDLHLQWTLANLATRT